MLLEWKSALTVGKFALTRAPQVVMKRALLVTSLTVLFMGLPPAVQAASPGAFQPGAGDLMQQAAPEERGLMPGMVPLVIPKPGDMPTDTSPLPVDWIVFSGNTIFDDATLQDVIKPEMAKGGHMSLKRLGILAEMVTQYYRQHGYLLSRAYIPEQVLTRGTITVAVVEAKYGKISVHNSSRDDDRVVNGYLSPLQSGDPVIQRSLYRSLLLLEQLPGVDLQPQLEPGAVAGTSDLVVDATPTQPVSGQVAVDNKGNRATGRTRVSGQVSVNSPLHIGDQLSLQALTSGKGLSYGSLGYSLPINSMGTRVGTSYSELRYRLQQDFSQLDAKGDARVASLWILHPLVLDDRSVLNVQLQGNYAGYDDRMINYDKDRNLGSGQLSIVGSHRDDFAGVTSASLSVTGGKVRFNNTVAETVDDNTVKTQGGYTVWRAALSRLQSITSRTRIYLGVNGQYSPHNVDSSEMFLLGGMNNLPGYESSTLSGVSGVLGTLALRHDLPLLLPGEWQGEVFADAGRITINANPAPSSQLENRATLYDAGLGLEWLGPQNWRAKAQLSQAIGVVPDIAGERSSVRAWFYLEKGF